MVVVPVDQHHVPADVEPYAVDPGVRQENAIIPATDFDNLLYHLVYATGKCGRGLINMEAVLFKHDLDLVPAMIELCYRIQA